MATTTSCLKTFILIIVRARFDMWLPCGGVCRVHVPSSEQSDEYAPAKSPEIGLWHHRRMSDVHVARYEVMDVLDNARVEKTSEKVWYTVWSLCRITVSTGAEASEPRTDHSIGVLAKRPTERD
jgi:hypothetical protein